MPVPVIDFAALQISRLVCGSNPFFGYSYRSSAHNAWQRKHFTVSRMADILEECLRQGITGVIGNYEGTRGLGRALAEVERRCGKRPVWIAYVSGDDAAMREGITSVAGDGADACYVQCGNADRCFTYNFVGQPLFDGNDTLETILDHVQFIRDLGLPAGMGSHHWRILKVMQERGYDADFMVTTLNYLAVYCEYAGAVRAINTIDKPFIVIKTLGGSAKITPEDGLTCAFTGIKPGDIVAVGMEHEEAVEQNARLAGEITGFLARR